MGDFTAELVTTARSLATDAACREVVLAWRAQGIESILLKGATTAQWLYPHEARAYADADLLVPGASLPAAAAVLGELGFEPVGQHVSAHAHPWVRAADGATIDLHATVWGPSRDPEHVWTELRRHTEPFEVGGATVTALTVPARALHIVLHAAQHRDHPRQPEDLRRALALTTLAQWREAQALADRLWALTPMAWGLALEPAGTELIEQLALVRAAAIAERDGARLAVGFARLAAAPGLRGKASVISTSLRIAAEELGSDGGAGRGPRALGAYARRAVFLLARAPATALSLRRGRVRAREQPSAQGQAQISRESGPRR